MRRVILIPDETGGYTGEVPSLPGCFSEGDTRAEAFVNIQDAIEGFIAVLREHGDLISLEVDLPIEVIEITEVA